MADCPNSNSPDCLPAGSNPAIPCSPCLDPTKDTFNQVLSDLAAQCCSQGNQTKAWNQRLEKFRNRLNRLEDEINNPPKPQDADPVASICANADKVKNDDGADGVLACDGGVTKVLSPGKDECLEIIAKGEKWRTMPHGLGFHPLATPQNLVLGVNATLTDYDKYKDLSCSLWAVVEFQCFVTSGSGGGTFATVVNGRNLDLAYIVNGGGDVMGGQGIAPLTSQSLAISLVTFSSSGSISFTSQAYKLLGYLA